MKIQNKPVWWREEHDGAWERIKEAFKRDWDQTRHDLGSEMPDTGQNVDNTLRQASGKEVIPPRGQPTFEDYETAYRFGYAARSHYQAQYPNWDSGLEKQLRKDWGEGGEWAAYVAHIRHGWDYPDRSFTKSRSS